jgi:hypothetical protein
MQQGLRCSAEGPANCTDAGRASSDLAVRDGSPKAPRKHLRGRYALRVCVSWPAGRRMRGLKAALGRRGTMFRNPRNICPNADQKFQNTRSAPRYESTLSGAKGIARAGHRTSDVWDPRRARTGARISLRCMPAFCISLCPSIDGLPPGTISTIRTIRSLLPAHQGGTGDIIQSRRPAGRGVAALVPLHHTTTPTTTGESRRVARGCPGQDLTEACQGTYSSRGCWGLKQPLSAPPVKNISVLASGSPTPNLLAIVPKC